jgi:hypothetical protein
MNQEASVSFFAQFTANLLYTPESPKDDLEDIMN